jgi:FtsP/CotA-like multicopper oxidase with cupredoxin domain
MRKVKVFTAVSILALAAGLFGLAPAHAPPAQAQAAASIIYNLYATDGYIEMADGTAVYNYGFIGGRETVPATPLTYQTSCIPGPIDPLTGIRPCTGSANVTIAGGVPAPTGGPWAGIDSQLAGNAQFPAPLVYAAIGDVVELRLKNLGVAANPDAPNDPHSIHLHGLDVDAANDGVPETSVGAVPANLCNDGTTAAPGSTCAVPAPGAGNVIVYMFTPAYEGTYMYHCHQEADIHVNMGMYGALVVYSKADKGNMASAYYNGGPGKGFGGQEFKFQYDKDYIMLLSEVDVRGHADEEGTYGPGAVVPAQTWDPFPYNWAQYKPQYWFVNGLSFPNTIHANFPSGYLFSDWLLAHPGYDPLITGSVSKPNLTWKTPGEKVLIRVINMGFETQPMHMHGYHGKILGSDQRAWDWANKPNGKFGVGMEKQTLTIGSGETYEWLVDFGQQSFQSTYPPGTQSCYDPATNLPVANAAGCTPIPEGGDPAKPPYIGGPVVTGAVGLPGASQLFPFHNHDDYKATNNGVYPGGMFTMLVPTP